MKTKIKQPDLMRKHFILLPALRVPCIIVLGALALTALAAGCKPKKTEVPNQNFETASEKPLETDTAFEIAFPQSIKDIDARLGREFKDEEMAEYTGMINASIKAGRIIASSFLAPDRTYTYVPENIHDLNFQNAWSEGVEGVGIGEYIAFHFGRNTPEISKIVIANGYVKSEKTYRENPRPKKLQMYIDDDPFAILHLLDVRREQVFTFGPVETSGRIFKFEILDVYPGDLYEDTSISEIYFNELPPADIQELNVGSVMNGNLGPGQEIWYSVRASTAGILSVETSGTTTDTYLEAYDAQRNLIAADDDSGGGGNAKIELMVTAPANYLFKLRGFSSSTTGAYRIMALHGPMPRMTELTPGSFQTGTITFGDEYWFRVKASETGPLTVETTGNNDTSLEARDENFGIITYDNDSGENFNAKIEINAVRGRTYYFKLGIYNDGTGPYRIIANNTAYPDPVPLAPGNVLSAIYNPPDENRWYSVRADQNGILVVETSGTIDLYLEAYNDTYDFITFNDDGGEDYNARVELFVEANRTYLFKLRALRFDNGTSYRIMANNTPYPAPVQLTPGRILSGNISPGEYYWYSVRTPGRGSLVMETTGSIDTYLEVYTDSYKLITSDDDGGEGGNARIELFVEANQTYIFRLRGFSREVSGPFRLFVSVEE